MSIWGIDRLAGVFAVWVLLSSNIEAAEIPKYSNNIQQAKNSLSIYRQGNLLNKLRSANYRASETYCSSK